MRLFNAFQLILVFAGAPFGIEYVRNAEFYAHNVLFWVLIVAYLWAFGLLTMVVADNLKD